MNRILRRLAVLAVGILVFVAARYLDNPPRVNDAEATSTGVVQTVPYIQETLPQETNAQETLLQETEAADAEQAETQPSQTEEKTEGAEKRLLLSFAGDCTLGCRDSHSYIDYGFNKVVGEDYGHPFRNVLRYFENDEFTFVNLEGALTDTGYPQDKPHAFRGPTSYVNILTENSVEGVSLANNHTMDYFLHGYASTKAALEGAGVPYVERDSSTIVTTENGLTIGIYGAVYYLLDEDVISAAISELRQQVDLVIFAPHWGTEGSYTQTQAQTDLAHAAIDAGADIVYGCHPHVLQPIEEYNGGIIYYSLGNFSFGGNIYPEDYDSVLIQQEVIMAADGSVSLGQTLIIPVCISSTAGRNDYQPTPYEEGSEEYDRVLAKLAGTWKK